MWARLKRRLGIGGETAPPASEHPPPTGSTPSAGEPRKTPIPDPPRQYFTDGFGLRIKDKTLDQVLQELEIVLLESDVALEVAERIERRVRARLQEQKLRLGEDPAEAIRAALREAIRSILAIPPLDLPTLIRAGPRPYVVLFLGVNGSGKTTTIAKLASLLQSHGFRVVLAAGDTFRAGAIEQISVHAERLGVRVVRQPSGADPAAVAYDAVQHARARHSDVVLVDTAGRQHTDENLIEEAKKIRRVVNPQLTVFVGDALSGNDMVTQARQFQKELGFEAVILTKLDADTKGGSALSIAYSVRKPILYLGTGQGYGDLRPFDPDWMVERIFQGSPEVAA
jgi:fused signal recognition particle receptor